MSFNESTSELATLEWFVELGYNTAFGPNIAPKEPKAERALFTEVVLESRLRQAIAALNTDVPSEAQTEALRVLLRNESPSLIANNRRFHSFLIKGIPAQFKRNDGSVANIYVKIIDFDNPSANDWLVVNQYAVEENRRNRRPDVVVFINGLPISVIELKNAADEEATLESAFQQLQTYKKEISSLFVFNEILITSDGSQARIGSLTANREWFKVWRTIDGITEAPASSVELEVLIRGVFEKRRLLDLIQYFIAYEDDDESDAVHKIIAGYHQYHAVNAAIEQTVRACGASDANFTLEEPPVNVRANDGKLGDRRIGVVWHTQGSGKSYSMLFYAGKLVRTPAMENPTLVVLTDRNDLDEQLHGQFLRCQEALYQKPQQAESVEDLRNRLNVASGGIVFTTLQKFATIEKGAKMPLLSSRRNIVVIADEAHRSQYDVIDGFARNLRDALPNASFIGFTGTPIEKADANTRVIFGDYISVYDIQQAVADGATVPIYYESRVAKLSLNQSELPTIDSEFEEITEYQEEDKKQKLKSKWAALEALVGDPKRIELIAKDLINHFEKRTEALDGKAMIVCMSRRICIDLLNAIVKLRPEWQSAEGDDKDQEAKKRCLVKIVMTGSASDGPDWQKHIRTKQARKELAHRFKDTRDPFKIVIVRDMWLTGFDAPCLHTMYADKPMQSHGLMQAIARVNRVFKDKPGGLVVDYLGLADQLKQALATYTESGGKGSPSIDTKQAVEVLLEKHEVVSAMFHGFIWDKWTSGSASEKLKLLPAAQEHILAQEDGKKRYISLVTDLSRAFALCAASDEAIEMRDDIAFFQAVKAQLAKKTIIGQGSQEDIESAIRQLVSKAITTDGEIIDIFSAAGIKRPDISILSDQFLTEVRGLKYKNVAAELLAKLLHAEIKKTSKKNVVVGKTFSELLQRTLNAYHNRAIATQEVIEELINLAKEIDKANRLGSELGLTEDEAAFYSALAANESAVRAMGNHELKVIAAELVKNVRESVTIDWTLRESARAKIKVMVKRILRKYGYPPDLQDDAIKTVLQQAEVLCADWSS